MSTRPNDGAPNPMSNSRKRAIEFMRNTQPASTPEELEAEHSPAEPCACGEKQLHDALTGWISNGIYHHRDKCGPVADFAPKPAERDEWERAYEDVSKDSD